MNYAGASPRSTDRSCPILMSSEPRANGGHCRGRALLASVLSALELGGNRSMGVVLVTAAMVVVQPIDKLPGVVVQRQ